MKKWTTKEDIALCKAVEEAGGDLMRAFRVASAVTGRTPRACAGRWKKIHGTVVMPSFTMTNYVKKEESPLKVPFQEKLSTWETVKLQFKKWFKR